MKNRFKLQTEENKVNSKNESEINLTLLPTQIVEYLKNLPTSHHTNVKKFQIKLYMNSACDLLEKKLRTTIESAQLFQLSPVFDYIWPNAQAHVMTS